MELDIAIAGPSVHTPEANGFESALRSEAKVGPRCFDI